MNKTTILLLEIFVSESLASNRRATLDTHILYINSNVIIEERGATIVYYCPVIT